MGLWAMSVQPTTNAVSTFGGLGLSGGVFGFDRGTPDRGSA